MLQKFIPMVRDCAVLTGTSSLLKLVWIEGGAQSPGHTFWAPMTVLVTAAQLRLLYCGPPCCKTRFG